MFASVDSSKDSLAFVAQILAILTIHVYAIQHTLHDNHQALVIAKVAVVT